MILPDRRSSFIGMRSSQAIVFAEQTCLSIVGNASYFVRIAAIVKSVRRFE